MYPLVYVLLPGKSQDIYTRFFTLLKSKMADLYLPLNTMTVFINFKSAWHNALKMVFPTTNIKGCFFHYTQCIWRKAQQTSLQQLYNNKSQTLPLHGQSHQPIDRKNGNWTNRVYDIIWYLKGGRLGKKPNLPFSVLLSKRGARYTIYYWMEDKISTSIMNHQHIRHDISMNTVN